VPVGKPFSIEAEKMTAQVFGDDALELLHLWINGARGRELDLMIVDLIYLTSWAIRQAGFGTNPDDLNPTDSTASFLNVFAWADAIWRRLRAISVKEKQGRKLVTDQVNAAAGAVMSGMSMYGYGRTALMAILTGEEESAFGYVAKTTVYTYLRPSDEAPFVTMLPYPRAPYMMFAALGKYLLPEQMVTVAKLTDITELAQEAASDLVTRGRASSNYLYHDEGSLDLRAGVMKAYEQYVPESIRISADAATAKLKALKSEERKLVLSAQPWEALISGVGDRLLTDRQVAPTLIANASFKATLEDVELAPSPLFSVGQRRLYFSDDPLYHIRTMGNGFVALFDENNVEVAGSLSQMLTPVVYSAAPEFLVMQSVFGISMRKESSLPTLKDTGAFSLNTVPGSSALGAAKDYAVRHKLGAAGVEDFLMAMGYDEESARSMAFLRTDLKFLRLVEDMEDWKSSRVPEMSLAISRFERDYILPMVEREISSVELEDEPADFARDLRTVVSDAIASITVNSALANITSYMDRSRTARKAPEIVDFYTKPGIHIATIFKFESYKV
jgi:hypothetical protein